MGLPYGGRASGSSGSYVLRLRVVEDADHLQPRRIRNRVALDPHPQPAHSRRSRVPTDPTQRELAESLGLKEQQINATRPRTMPPPGGGRVAKLIDGLGVQVRQDVVPPGKQSSRL